MFLIHIFLLQYFDPSRLGLHCSVLLTNHNEIHRQISSFIHAVVNDTILFYCWLRKPYHQV